MMNTWITPTLQSKRVLLGVTGSIAAKDSEERAATQRRRSNPRLNQET
jgi:phosphopantothenoylcysteine synthetase/decarboxylase